MATSSKDIIDIIIDLLQTNFKTRFKKYYYGDPVYIPQSLMPCIAIDQDSQEVDEGRTGMDKLVESLKVIVMVNKKVDFGNNDSGAHSLRTLKDLVYGLSETTGDFYPTMDTDNVVGVLRKNLTLVNNVYNQDVTVEFGLSNRVAPNLRSDNPLDSITAEARISMTVEREAYVNNRS